MASINRVLLGFFTLAILSTSASAAERDFVERYQTNDTGDIAIIGNLLASCSESDLIIAGNAPLAWDAGSCNAVRAGNVPTYNGGTPFTGGLANNYWHMYNVNADTGGGRVNSSSSLLTMPAGSEVLWAGLYWGGDAATPDSQMSFKTPTVGYQTITAAGTDFYGTDYQSYAEVTSLVTSGGNGTYWGADVNFRLGEEDAYAGWSLVVVYKNTTLPFRNLTVYDGYKVVYNGNNVDITLSGFLTPSSGTVTASLGLISYEGDTTAYINDQMLVDGVALSDAQNPISDYFNSSVSYKGARVTTKSPDYVNQMAYDADVVDASSFIGNSVTSTTMTFTTSGDVYFPGVAAIAIDIYVPDLKSSFNKTIVDINGGALVPGDILEYTVDFTNTGLDGADKVVMTDPLLGPTTYVPNSISIATTDTDPTAVSGPMSDGSGNDAAEFISGTNTIIARLGRGANSTSGGLIPAGVQTTLTFQVTVNADAYGQNIANTANIDYESETLGTSFSDSGVGSIDVDVAAFPILTLIKTVTNDNLGTSSASAWMLTATGPETINGLTSSATVTNAEMDLGTYVLSEAGPTGYDLTLSCVNANATGTDVTVVNATTPNLTLAYDDDVTCTFNNDDSSSIADLTITKSLTTSAPFTSGQTIEYSIVVTNAATSLDAASNIAIQDLPTNLIVTSAAGPNTSCTMTPASGITTSVDCVLSTLAIGGSETITIQATAP